MARDGNETRRPDSFRLQDEVARTFPVASAGLREEAKKKMLTPVRGLPVPVSPSLATDFSKIVISSSLLPPRCLPAFAES